MKTKTPEERAKDIFDRSHNPSSPHLIDMIAEALREAEQRGGEKPWPTRDEFENWVSETNEKCNWQTIKETALFTQGLCAAYDYLAQHAAPKATVDDDDPYCQICGACGHEGCCSPDICAFKETYDKSYREMAKELDEAERKWAALQSNKAQDVSEEEK